MQKAFAECRSLLVGVGGETYCLAELDYKPYKQTLDFKVTR